MEGLETLDTVLARVSPTWSPTEWKSSRITLATGEVVYDNSFEKRVQLSVQASGLPPVTRGSMRLTKYDPDWSGKNATFREAHVAATKLAHGEPPYMLTLVGPPGVGKTHLAVAVGWEWAEKGALVTYARLGTLLQELRASYDAADTEYSFDSRWDRLVSSHLVILDDMGSSKLTDWGMDRLDDLVDYRWLRGLPLIVATNALSRDLPARVADRLSDVSTGIVAVMKGPSHRRGGQT